MTAPTAVEEVLAELDFAPTCEINALDDGRPDCPNIAVAYIEFHRAGDCKHPSCNSAGNMCGTVCAEHLDYYRAAARDIIANCPDQVSGRPVAAMICGSCRRRIRTAADILQRVEYL